MKKSAIISVDIEQDCPPFLTSYLGIERGLPKLLDLFKQEAIKATCFTTGIVAERYPELVTRLVQEGHELACHGYSHKRFDHMTRNEAELELNTAKTILKKFSTNVISFRAPNLQFPDEFLDLLQNTGFLIDSSTAAYKPPFTRKITNVNGLTRIPATITSSILRLPFATTVLSHISPLVIFVHPWEFIDMSQQPIRWDCKFNTGEKALNYLQLLIHQLKRAGYQFLSIAELAIMYNRNRTE